MRTSGWGVLGLGVLGLLTVVSFQNCGGTGFKPALDQSSAQCRAEAAQKALDEKIPAAEIDCSDFNSFACERRIFSPDLADLRHALKECTPGGQVCVDVDVLQFNTAAARAGATPAAFEPGGDYNREDIRCYHRLRSRGVVVIESGGDSLAEALANAVKLCEQAREEE